MPVDSHFRGFHVPLGSPFDIHMTLIWNLTPVSGGSSAFRRFLIFFKAFL